MRIINAIILLIVATIQPAWSQHFWMADSLGEGYEKHYIDLGKDFGGDARCTVVRFECKCDEGQKRAVLYIHGYNDYFFQKELAEQFSDHGYNFFAVDLRRYGRSLLPGQKPFIVRDFKDYFQDIDSVLAIIKNEGNKEIVLMGHSTGGLLAAYYVASNPDSGIDALVLNSPFLDWNLGKMECLINVASALGRLFPNIKVSTGGGGVYKEALLKRFHGEWDYDTTLKSTDYGVDLGWVRAVNIAQHNLRKMKGRIKIPILLMYSSKSSNPENWTPEASKSDVVLDVNDIKRYGSELGPRVTSVRVNGGMHDLILSAKNVRYPLYNYIFRWLEKYG